MTNINWIFLDECSTLIDETECYKSAELCKMGMKHKNMVETRFCFYYIYLFLFAQDSKNFTYVSLYLSVYYHSPMLWCEYYVILAIPLGM